jgi:hypothetical protein
MTRPDPYDTETKLQHRDIRAASAAFLAALVAGCARFDLGEK